MGIRIIKTAVAVVLAIYLAQSLGLHSPYSTGLLAILGVDVTKRKGVRTSLQRIVASFLGLLIAAYLFWLLGFHIWVIGIYILILFPILARFQLKEGVVTGSVVMFHVFIGGQISSDVILNEVALLLVGLGTATLINIIYMPKEDRQLLDLRERLETCFSHIFKEISNHLRDNRYVWSGSELLESNDILQQAMNAVKRSKENALFHDDTVWAVYFYMRKQQMDSVDRMVQYVAQVYQTLPHGELLASVFDEISEDVKVEHYTGRSEKKLELLERKFQEMPLPASREEFEVRSALLQLMVELKSYLAVAKREKKQREPAAYADSE
ncbi:aromatic acid exporter family protein [Paenibacillus radicis (ex Xue et al. 2023)]|uniref:Aromatic acid exporter family protein n=1 Tax=Paenibacillus radicis (ex Xue et al. 2023) TaxID=2972489 RepID=A0ABT1YI48_9BACL|nr:aromatic acid exporter family protein [Paenibacillus radicis (ex Xue et al. 2023)]MCR8631933.1 aromatic acid exporter family protein [Paenibacillus radicis (ex Xue et al. 2023)]